jgi:hypothetical protein
VDECGLSIADACEGVALAQKLIAFEHCLKVWLIAHTLQSSMLMLHYMCSSLT